MSWFFREPSRDPRLAEALRQLEAAPAAEEAEALHEQIMAAARTRLAALRAPAPRWWEWLDRWIPVAVPVGLAVSLAGTLLLPGSGELSLSASSSVELGADSTLVTAALSDPTGTEQATARLIAPEGDEWIFEQALSR